MTLKNQLLKKKVIVLLLVLFSGVATMAQDVAIPDENFKSALLQDTLINLNNDAEIQVSEANAFSGELDVSHLDIADLTGIEAFVGLRVLDCSYNNLNMLDVSSNTALEQLSCRYNDLVELTLGEQPALVSLLAYGNQLVELDLSQCLALETVRIGTNSFVQLDLSGNTNLTTIDVRACQLQSLNIQNGNNERISFFNAIENPDLSCVTVDDVEYATTNWTNIDKGLQFSTDCFPYKATIVVNSQSVPVEGAVITVKYIDELVQQTNVSGEAVFESLGNYDFLYRVEAEGYKSYVGRFYVTDGDASETINLEPGVTDEVHVSDEAFLEFLLADSDINSNGDDLIQTSEAAFYKQGLEVKSLGIESMSGIEFFANISELDCSGNAIDSLDLTENTYLERIDCSYNSMDTLLMGDNNLVTRLDCQGNKLTGIYMGLMTALEVLNCGRNEIVALDLRYNSMLTSFNASYNQLSFLNVSNGNNASISNFIVHDNPSLFCVTVDEMAYSIANWTNKDEHTNYSTDCTVSYQLTFVVSNGENQIEGAHIKINGLYYDSGENGEVVLANMASGMYSYSVIADGYESVQDEILVEGDMTKEIVLTEGSSSIVYIPDYQFRTYLLNNSSINTNLDKEIQVAEAVAVDSILNVKGLGIFDLTGIGAFASIHYLDCSYNNLSVLEIDQQVWKSVRCHNNTLLEQLVLGDQPELETLFCYGSQMASVDVSGLAKLSVLRCGNSLITEMDLRQNTNLTTFDCRGSKLVQLDLRNGNNESIEFFNVVENPDLSCVSVDNIDYAMANWTMVDEGLVFGLNCNGSDDATLQSISVDGTVLDGFLSDVFTYEVEVPESETAVPMLTAVPSNANAIVEITQAEAILGTAIIEVLSETGLQSELYIVQFSPSTDIDAIELESVKLYPNPAKDKLYLFIENLPRELIIYNATGDKVKSISPTGNMLDISALKRGVYYLHISVSSKAYTLKFVKTD